MWQTYLGTSGTDNPYALNIGPDNLIYIIGTTTGTLATSYGTGAPAHPWTNRAGTNGGQAFVAKMDSGGRWAVVRELGSVSANWGITMWDLRSFPTTGNAFDLVGVGSLSQQSAAADGDIPAVTLPGGGAKTGGGGGADLNGWAFRLTSNLQTLVWTKQYSSNGSFPDQFNIALVNGNNVYIGGYTDQAVGNNSLSFNNPSGQVAIVGHEDGWLMQLNGTDGTTNWSRYFNAATNDTVTILCMEFNQERTQIDLGGLTTGLAAANNINISGGTDTVPEHGARDFFIASIPISGAATTWGRYFGGSRVEDNMMGLNVDQNDDIYVLGYTFSKDIPTPASFFPIQNGTFNNTASDRQAVFFKLSSTTGDTVLYCTYMGGSSDDFDPVGERGIKFANCRIYLAVTSGSQNFPMTTGYFTPTKTSANNVLDPLIVSMGNPPDITGNNIVSGGNQNISCGAIPDSIVASAPVYVIGTITRNGVIQTLGTGGSYPAGPPVIISFQWQVSYDSRQTGQILLGPLIRTLYLQRH